MGKTTLLEDLIRAAPDFMVVRVSGVESETELGFAALHRLLGPHLGSFDSLPQRQREALDSSFGLRPEPASDPFLVGLSVLTLMSDAATRQPLLCVVDDAQWVDHESLAALSFAGRRLFADRVVLVLAFRDPYDGRAALPEGLPTLHVAGLSERAATELLRSLTPVPLHDDVERRLSVETEGSPLAIVELVGQLSKEQLVGADLLPDPLPIGARLEMHFLRLAYALPPSTQTILLLAAAEPSGDPVVVGRAAEALGLSLEDGEAAESAGLLQLAPVIVFRHPLIRSAIYGGAAAGERRRVHRALAATTDRATLPDRWAWHAALAAVGPDDDVAEALERSAEVARSRGGIAAEARFLQRAAELTADRRARTALQLRAAQASLRAGAVDVASTLLDQATPLLDEVALRVEADRLAAAMRAFTSPGTVPALLLSAAQAIEASDLDAARETYTEAIQACMVSCQLTVGTTPEAVARAALVAPSTGPGEPSIADLLLDGFATRLADGYTAGAPRLKLALERLAVLGESVRGLRALGSSGQQSSSRALGGRSDPGAARCDGAERTRPRSPGFAPHHVGFNRALRDVERALRSGRRAPFRSDGDLCGDGRRPDALGDLEGRAGCMAGTRSRDPRVCKRPDRRTPRTGRVRSRDQHGQRRTGGPRARTGPLPGCL